MFFSGKIEKQEKSSPYQAHILMRERANYHHILKFTNSEKRRYRAAKKIMELTYQLDELYAKKDNRQTLTPAEPNRGEVDRGEVESRLKEKIIKKFRRLQDLRSRISKTKRKLKRKYISEIEKKELEKLQKKQLSEIKELEEYLKF